MNLYVYSLNCSKANSQIINYIINELKSIYNDLEIIDYDDLDKIDLSKIDELIFSGGDGIFHNIINKCYNSKIIFGYIPLGTANDIAHNMNIKSVNKALEVIKNRKVGYYPIIKINDKFFVYALSVGEMSNVSIKTKKELKKTFTKTIYKLKGIRYIFTKKTRIKVTVENITYEEKVKALICVRSSYLGGVKINNNLCNDYLYVIFIKNIFDLIKMFIFKKIKSIKTNQLTIISSGLWCLDGEKTEIKEALVSLENDKIKIYQ